MPSKHYLDYVKTLPLVEALWWFIENCEGCADRTEIFFHLRQEVRKHHAKNDAVVSPRSDEWKPVYSRWRHGGWYVSNIRYPSGACGCVSNNYPDKKWRIVCDDRRGDLGGPTDFTFPTRDAAARAELELASGMNAAS